MTRVEIVSWMEDSDTRLSVYGASDLFQGVTLSCVTITITALVDFGLVSTSTGVRICTFCVATCVRRLALQEPRTHVTPSRRLHTHTYGHVAGRGAASVRCGTMATFCPLRRIVQRMREPRRRHGSWTLCVPVMQSLCHAVVFRFAQH